MYRNSANRNIFVFTIISLVAYYFGLINEWCFKYYSTDYDSAFNIIGCFECCNERRINQKNITVITRHRRKLTRWFNAGIYHNVNACNG